MKKKTKRKKTLKIQNKQPHEKIKYTDEYLMELLLEFIKKFPLTMLNSNQLAKNTPVPRHTWDRRMKEQIEKLKIGFQVERCVGTDEYVVFYNIEDIVEKYWDSKDKLIVSLKDYERTIQEFYKRSKAYDEVIVRNQDLQGKVRELEEQMKLQRKETEFYKKEMERLSVLSLSSSERTDNGLRNVIEINKDDKQSIEKASSLRVFLKDHSQLFGS